MVHVPFILDAEELRVRLTASPGLKHLAASIEAIPLAVEHLWSANHQPWFTDHGPDHSRRTAAYALDLARMPMLNPALQLSTLELFILWSSAWLHDIGMQDLEPIGKIGEIDHDGFVRIRKNHPDRSSKRILDGWASLRLPAGDDSLAEVVAFVARAHGTAFYRDTVENHVQQRKTILGQEVRPRSLAALLLFADELDLTSERVELFAGWGRDNPISEAHKFKHRCVRSAKVACDNDGRISTTLDVAFPQALSGDDATAIRRWIEVKLQRQMAMIEPEIRTGFSHQVRFDRFIRTAVSRMQANVDVPTEEALAFIRADVAGDVLIDHRDDLRTVSEKLEQGQIVLVLPHEESAAGIAGDGRADLLRLVHRQIRATGRTSLISMRLELNEGGTAADIVGEWLRDSGGVEPRADSDEKSRRAEALQKLVESLRANNVLKPTLLLERAELLDQESISWLFKYAAPRLKSDVDARFVIAATNSVEKYRPDDDSVIIVKLDSLVESDVVEYLSRSVDRDVAIAEATQLRTYARVRQMAQAHELVLAEKAGDSSETL